MGQYLLRRLIISVPVLLGITMATYAIISFAPGDPVTALISPEAAASLGPGWVEQQKEALGLNKPIPVRYALWLKELARGNLGFSYKDRQPIGPKVVERLVPTLKLMGTALLIGLLIAVPLGVLSAIKQYSFIDYLSTVAGFAAISIPSFFLGLAAIYRHALRDALIPLVTVVALNLPRLLGGTVIIEAIFAWPGMGTLAITAVQGRDYPVIMAINLIAGTMILLSNLLADVVYAVIDPRIKYS